MDGREVSACLLLLVWSGALLPSSVEAAPPSNVEDLPLPGESLAETPLPEKKIEGPLINSDVLTIRKKPSASLRPYSLSLLQDDYHYSPKPKHLRAARLLRLLGPSFDPFWMSVENPQNRSADVADLVTLSQDLADGATRYQRKLLREAQELNLHTLLPRGESSNTTEAISARLHQWLVDSATCKLTSSWVDLGPVFWPRWVRHTDCNTSYTSCSWPPGMVCRQAQLTHIKLLAWHCWMGKDPLSTGRLMNQCTWRQIPYPVVVACKCSCRNGGEDSNRRECTANLRPTCS
ncbi:noggin-1-like [Rhinatrema bivittatum]|uniref:noggin-1-like n=1 Tax=Rhinatrema bivittatum TaxID=194408 RepID=UPI00112BF30D|nr:noggin-1-like [Rhinatrema bivittatum]